MEKKQYSLFTAISMIVGIVIGSGIFFKSYDILNYTGGSVALGVMVFAIAAISIIFGSLAVCQLALRSDKPGGVITYMEETWSKSLAGAFGWFHALIYLPTLIVVVSWVAGIYICQLFGLPSTLTTQCLIGIFATLVCFVINVFSKRLGDILQISTTVLKLVPLLLLAVLGIVFGNPSHVTVSPVVANTSSFGFIAAIVPIAFAFDGWIVATSISHEVKNAKKALPIALVVSPIFILVLYSLYLVGLSSLLSPEYILANKDTHLFDAASMIFGTMGAKIILTFVVVSVLGTVNGLVIGLMRVPYSLAGRKVFPCHEKVSKLNSKLDVPVLSSVVGVFICLVWYVLHYFVMDKNLGFDVSEIAIVMSYIFYVALYFGVIKLYKKGEITSKLKGLVFPILATLGSLIIFLGSVIDVSNPDSFFNIRVILFMVISFTVIMLSKFYCKSKEI